MSIPTPEDLESVLRYYEEQAQRAEAQARRWRELADMTRETLRLRDSQQNDTISKVMTSAARAHISAGRSRQEHGEVDALVACASQFGHTLRSLATAVEAATGRRLSYSAISRARRGERAIRRSAAVAIEQLIGFPAVRANWPGGWSRED